MEAAVCFSMRADIPSGPLDLLMSRDPSSSQTLSSLHSSSCGKLSGSDINPMRCERATVSPECNYFLFNPCMLSVPAGDGSDDGL